MVRMDVATLREGLSDAINRAGYGSERIVVERRGRPVCALVPLADIERLESPTATTPDETASR